MNTDIIFQGPNGEILLKDDTSKETIWASLDQIAKLFGRNKSTISRHIKNIFNNEELSRDWVIAKIATTASDWKNYQVEYYNLDMILSVWYRVDSKQATEFRKWSNSILASYITQWISINTSLLEKNTQKFRQALEYLQDFDTKKLDMLDSKDIIFLIQNYAQTWFNLDSYDKVSFPQVGFTKKHIHLNANDLQTAIEKLKQELILKHEATPLFAQEKMAGSIEGILWNIFQTFDGKDVYESIEEKAAHLLYFMVKNHPFTDGNKRSGAFSFLWFLQKSGYKRLQKISPEALTTLTLLTAESNPKEKDKIIGLILLLLQ